MDAILDFLADNRLIFAVISLVLLFALVGLISNNKKKKKTTEDVDSQPISMEEKNIQEKSVDLESLAGPTLIIEDKLSSQEPVFEPSLDGFASNANDVKVSGMNMSTENDNMLVIEDKSLDDAPTLVIEDNSQSLGTQQFDNSPAIQTPVIENQDTYNDVSDDAPMLVIEDKSVDDGPTLVIEDNNEVTNEKPMLVLDDNTPEVGVEVNNTQSTIQVEQPVDQKDEIQETLDL